MRSWGVCCAGAAVVLAAASARADTCPVPEGGSATLAQLDARARIDFLHQTVDAQARYARIWKWAWVGIGSATFASSAAQAIGWAAGNDKTREANVVDNTIVSAFSIVTPIFAVAFALRVEKDAPAIDELLRQTGDGAAGSCLVLARMEELFQKDADEEALNTGFFAHAAAILGVGAMVAILAIEAAVATDPDVRDAHWLNAATNGIGGLILTEAQVLSTPRGAVGAYRRYLKGDLPRVPRVTFAVVPLVANPGIAFEMSF